jgi:hypothetical protein
MTIIPDEERCIGTGGAPWRTGTRTDRDDSKTGLCPVCFGRFTLRDGLLIPEHRAASADEREDPNQL